MDRTGEIKPLDLTELESVSGGSSDASLRDLSQFVRRIVCNVINYSSAACLTLHKTPGGEVIPGIGWKNGESIMVHRSYSADGWLFAFGGGKYGYVSSNYVR